IHCGRCGEQRRNVGHGLCNRCALADPDRPFRYAASLAGQMAPAPSWWDPLVEFTAARYYPSGTVAVLRETGRLLISDPSMTPHQLGRLPTTALTATTGRVLTAFFTLHGLALAPDRPHQRAAARRARFVAAIANPLRDAVAKFDHTQTSEQDRRRRTGQRTLSDITLETRLRILRDLAAHLHTSRTITGWAEVSTTDLEAFLARAPAARHQRTYVLRRFFTWANGRKLVLTNPARVLSLGAQPAFTGIVLDIDAQRALFARWTRDTTPDQERLVGLLALLHAASNTEIRHLRVADIDTIRRTVALAGRPFPTPLDPPTWTALQRCLASRETARTLNPHVIITRVTSGRDTAADSSYLTRLLAPARTTPEACRQTRLTELVNDLDPKLAAVALGMNDNGLVRYAADNVARDRLQHRLASPP
ncbi:MAG: integrase, partial [Propionibacteriales bacterium]|nr:integrase [Propionibacteriales bacterium]